MIMRGWPSSPDRLYHEYDTSVVQREEMMHRTKPYRTFDELLATVERIERKHAMITEHTKTMQALLEKIYARVGRPEIEAVRASIYEILPLMQRGMTQKQIAKALRKSVPDIAYAVKMHGYSWDKSGKKWRNDDAVSAGSAAVCDAVGVCAG